MWSANDRGAFYGLCPLLSLLARVICRSVIFILRDRCLRVSVSELKLEILLLDIFPVEDPPPDFLDFS